MIHPSMILRLVDAGSKTAEFDRFVSDLKQVPSLIPAVALTRAERGSASLL
jgi:hypothetical protein